MPSSITWSLPTVRGHARANRMSAIGKVAVSIHPIGPFTGVSKVVANMEEAEAMVLGIDPCAAVLGSTEDRRAD